MIFSWNLNANLPSFQMELKYVLKKKKPEAQLEIHYTMKLFLMSVLCRLFNAKNLHVLKKTKY